MKHLIIVAMIEPYTDPIPEGTEVWGVNRTYVHQDGLTRVFFFDSLEHFPDGFIEELNSLKVPVVTRKHYEEIELSEPYPLQEILEFYKLKYFTCTIPYMLALAIKEGFKKITLHGMYHPLDSTEYMHHKACVEYWCGIAVGNGVELEISGDTNICKPYLFQSGLYGYVGQRNELLSIQTIAPAYRAAISYPISFFNADEDGPDWKQADIERLNGALKEKGETTTETEAEPEPEKEPVLTG
jgi:hypothetical protein